MHTYGSGKQNSTYVPIAEKLCGQGFLRISEAESVAETNSCCAMMRHSYLKKVCSKDLSLG